jgi:peptide/nickel transport system substrate-binding protein
MTVSDNPTTPSAGPLGRRAFLRGALGGGAVLLLAACQAAPPAAAPTGVSGAQPTVATKPTAASGAAATSGPTATSKPTSPAGALIVSLPSKLVTPDPHGTFGADRGTLTAARQIFDSLTVRDPASGEIKPGLATAWTTPDPTTWEFTLRPNVQFHDGTPVTSADVKASMERIVAQKGPLAPLWADVATIETPDNGTLRLKTKTPVGTVLTSASLLLVGPAGKIDQDGFFTKPIGSGPFRLKSWTPDAQMVLEANASHWAGVPGVASLTFKDIPEVAARVTALQTGEINFTWGLPPDQLPPLRNDSKLAFDTVPAYANFFVWFGAKREPFTDKRVRQAMWHALDLDGMVKGLLQGVGTRSQAPIPPTVFGFAPQTPYAYDPAKARQLLAEAGKPNGFETGLLWSPGNAGPQDREIAQAMISAWNAIGVKVKSVEQERAQWLKDLLALNWDMDFQTNSVITGDADFALRRLYTSSANRTGYANADLDKILNEAAATLDQKQRQDLYAQANKIIWEDAVGIFPFDIAENYIRRTTVRGFVPDPSQTPNFNKVSISA